MKTAVILAAGLGKRMGGNSPKVLAELNGRTLISHLMHSVEGFFQRIIVVVGFKGELVKEEVLSEFPNVEFTEQKEQLGTGHAVMMALPMLTKNSEVYILNGDTPLLKRKSLEELGETHKSMNSDLTVGLLRLDDPMGYGRALVNNGLLERIVEEGDADENIRSVRLVNGGVYLLDVPDLKDGLSSIGNDNAQKEYYLTDIVSVLNGKGKRVAAHVFPDNWQLMGVNTPEQLKELEKYV